jgi:2-oxoglutarate ferredoxin oxidoreductase subunit gamma
MSTTRIVFSGSGGQGVITAAILLGHAAAISEGRWAVQTQSYGPEARGGATRADVVISDNPIYYPKVINPNIMVCLTEEAFNKYSSLVRPGGLLLSDPYFVSRGIKIDAKQVELPMYETVMSKLSKHVAFNICMLGALIGISRVVRPESVLSAIEEKMPAAFFELNRKALLLGLELSQGLSGAAQETPPHAGGEADGNDSADSVRGLMSP